jgi:sterol desaturase/sphingolipid hydroxylase (fatty acid hydroxylase superfamily)
MSYIHLAIPVFFALMAVEFLAARLLERETYRLADSVADLSCGILQQVLEVFLKTALFAGYAWLFASHRLFDVPAASAWAWAACFVGVDFLYYWFHRWSHEVNAGWAAHAVHHQSEEYNLSVALRQGALQPAFSWVFYLPLALLGFPPAMFLAVSSFNTLYQFWIHTRLVGRLGPLEWVLNTPSHHRVHHGRNPRYIDRNHGGTLIVWDRLFGTFGEERDEPVYGVTRPLASWNPLWANAREWVEMWRVARRAARPMDRLRVLWKRPGWRPGDLGGYVPPPEVDRATYVRYDVPVPRALKAYVLVHFASATAGAVVFLYATPRLGADARAAGALAIALTLASLGGLLDRRAWATPFEAARVVALAGAAAVIAGWGAIAGAAAAAAVASLLALRYRASPGAAGELASSRGASAPRGASARTRS